MFGTVSRSGFWVELCARARTGHPAVVSSWNVQVPLYRWMSMSLLANVQSATISSVPDWLSTSAPTASSRSNPARLASSVPNTVKFVVLKRDRTGAGGCVTLGVGLLGESPPQAGRMAAMAITAIQDLKLLGF